MKHTKTAMRWTFVLALLLSLHAAAAAQGFDVKSHTLKNGMKVLVQEDRSIPNVAHRNTCARHSCRRPV